MGDFLKCPRLYYLHNVYKDAVTKNKIALVTPHMSLGIAVHEVLEGLADFPSESRMERDLLALYNDAWKKVAGKRGGFTEESEEKMFKDRGVLMLENVKKTPRFLPNKRLKLPRETMNPNFYLSEEDNIILNGLVDWIEYLPETDSLHIVDFKTGKKEESESSLQLPIYLLLCHALQKRKVTKASYWYLESDTMIEKKLPEEEASREAVLQVARKVKKARDEGIFLCPEGTGGCMHCLVYEEILKAKKGEDAWVESVGQGQFKQELFIVKKKEAKSEEEDIL
jgi:ATP-dependent helicase/DNAse subunit B